VILARGKLYDTDRQEELLNALPDALAETLAGEPLSPETVIDAIDALGRRIAAGEFDTLIRALPVENAMGYKDQAVALLSREYLTFKLETELGADFFRPYVTAPPHHMLPLRVRAMPLGVLMHIAAGNVDGLPAFSVAEGLLTGNINLLKLPQADNGLTLTVLTELIRMEPRLADFIYVFDTPSSDLAAMKRMADLSDGIVTWGGDAAVTAVRKFALPGTKLIEWGHKLSFAYISGYQDRETELAALAEHIAATRQLLCSSCQTIFLDTDDMADIHAFCEAFLPYMERAARAHLPSTPDAAAEITLRRYTDRLERLLDGGEDHRFRGNLCELIPCEDSELELSQMFGSCPVKRLPRAALLPTLRRNKQYLQTAGLICESGRRDALTELLIRSGVVRVTRAGSMSASFAGEAHDGEYPLRRYVRIVNEEPDA